MSEKIDFYNSLELTLIEAENLISDGVDNSKSLFHTPVLSTFVDKTISTRTVVLREFDSKNRTLRFHTDNRAAKIENINENSSATVVGYDPELKIQIKLQGKASVHVNDSITEKAWNESTARSKKCYSVKDGSSKEIENAEEYDITDFEVEEGYKNFAVIIFKFHNLEFLYLKSSGHRRALHKWDSDYSCSWLVP